MAQQIHLKPTENPSNKDQCKHLSYHNEIWIPLWIANLQLCFKVTTSYGYLFTKKMEDFLNAHNIALPRKYLPLWNGWRLTYCNS